MVGASKILTVSYGTFSCTLEGFEDPFSTMRSIAEYFRDLAADDRYFGAEPPTPDAEMLHRIAEKEINRRVEARVQDNGIVLRQLDRDEGEAPASPAPAPEVAAGAAAYAASQATAYEAEYGDTADPATEDLPAAASVEDLSAQTQAAMPAESVAEKLSRIRAVVSNARAEDAKAAETYVDPAELSDVLDTEDEGFDDDATEEDIAEALSAFDETDDAEEDTPDLAATAEADAEPAFEAVEVADVSDESGYGSHETDPVPHEPVAEYAAPYAVSTPHAEEITEALPEMQSPETAAEVDLDDVPAAEAWMAEAEEDDDDLNDAVAEAEVEAEAEFEAEPEVEAEAEAEVEIAAEAKAEVEDDLDVEPVGRIVKLSRSEFEAEYSDWDDEDDTDEDDAKTAVAEGSDDAWGGFDEDDEDDDLPVAATSDDEAEVKADAFDDWDDEDEDEDRWAASAENRGEPAADHGAASETDDQLTAGIRAALGKMELNDSSDDDRDDDADGFDDDVAASDTKDAAAARSFDDEDDEFSPGQMAARDRLGVLAEPEEKAANVDRLMEKTNSQMQESEGSRRRSAIAHLKAAVAATKADRLLKRVTSRESSEAEEQTQYRDDLAQVVRPRRPSEAGGTSSERPQPIGQGSSPLMLVSELRVDEGTGGMASIRPRRIVHDAEADANADAESSGYEDSAGFADFAEKMGANELPDLLEAAAAYAAFVENRPHFSRPQLMKRVAKHDANGEFTREAGLRSFGQLLRQGKIRKLKRGQFTVADTTRFNPEARIAGE